MTVMTKVTRMTEGTTTILAHVRSLACVSYHVALQMRFLAERLQAVGTLEGSFVRVNAHMFLEIPRLCERQLAHFAGERFLPCMSSDVASQLRRVHELLVAGEAYVSLCGRSMAPPPRRRPTAHRGR